MTWTFEATNIAGIVDGEASLDPGLNVIRASNWQGKSSFIKTLETALGVSAPLRESAQSGHVRYESPDYAGTVELERSGRNITVTGSPVLADEYDVVRAELFACLGEDNDLRQAVRSGESLEELMLRPLDFENIEEQIAALTREREQVDTEIERAEQAEKQLPAVESRVAELQDQLEELRTTRAQLDDAQPAVDEPQSSRQELSRVESERNRVENRIEQLEQTIERTEASLAEKESELEAIDIGDDSSLQSDLSAAQDRLRELKRDKRVLESVHSATEMVLTEDRLDLITEVDRELTGETFTCWTCGSETSSAAVEERLEGLRQKISAVQANTDAQQTRVEELEAKQETISQTRRRRDTLEADIAQLREKVSEDRQSLATAADRLEDIKATIEALSQEVTDQMDELTTVESDIKYREAELEDVRSNRAELQERAEQLELLRDEREELTEELTSLRDRKARIRQETREAFDTAMTDILDRFETGFETARLTPNFELVVARDGQEASIDALSEGEVELLGFVAALAGYEAFDVAAISPLLLVDQVGGLAEHNLRVLIEYLQQRTEYLVSTAYPAFDVSEGNLIDPEQWSVATPS